MVRANGRVGQVRLGVLGGAGWDKRLVGVNRWPEEIMQGRVNAEQKHGKTVERHVRMVQGPVKAMQGPVKTMQGHVKMMQGLVKMMQGLVEMVQWPVE
ncbi:MAG: hypothetical protein KDA71_23720, partial [Planctomycetales bacterium]|nr:hypothetical protein [Planctomycetales bacterium]